jgi:predicted nucleic acid-binding Zn ribbon protein
MSELECDDCGTINPEGATACELCGESLIEEQERAKLGNPMILFVVAVCATGALFVMPGVLLAAFYGAWVWAPYLAAWAVGAVVGRMYTPKEHYYLGWDMGQMGYMDNPFSYQDDIDRAHMGIGMAFVPMNLVVGLWEGFFKALGARKGG